MPQYRATLELVVKAKDLDAARRGLEKMANYIYRIFPSVGNAEVGSVLPIIDRTREEGK